MFVPVNAELMTYTPDDAADLMRLADWLCDAVAAEHAGKSVPLPPEMLKQDIAVGAIRPLCD